MPSGEIINELRKMSEDSDLSSRDAQRLTLCVLAEMYETLEASSRLIQSLQNGIDTVEGKLDHITEDMNGLKVQIKEINDNPLVSLGKHLKAHPKLAMGYLLIGMVLITWLPYLNLIRLLLLWVGVPAAIVDMLTPAVGGP